VKYRLTMHRVDKCKLMLTCVCMDMDHEQVKIKKRVWLNNKEIKKFH
jgi:hypothetical protein